MVQVKSEHQDQDGTRYHNASTTQDTTATPQNLVPLKRSREEEDHVAAAGSGANAESNGGGSTNDDGQGTTRPPGRFPAYRAEVAALEKKEDDKKRAMGRESTPPPPIMPPDRRPTPGRIINAREVNEHGAEPVFSRGDPAEWPNVCDKDYSHRFSRDDNDDDEGPPKKIGRRKNPERVKWEEERPLKDQNHRWHDLHLCYQRGPSEQPPTYDSAGYQLDYEKVANWMKPTRRGKRPSWQKESQRIEDHQRVQERVREIFFEPGAAPPKGKVSPAMQWTWVDRVSKDLGVPFHQVGLEEFEEWEKRGFEKAKEGDYGKFSEEQNERMLRIASGSAMRKGSCKTKI
ncbi:hypothetical protein BFW01_g11864 [Lasiodiplodia theobromae]|nr:hypothetical protein BFW01_g11864 [Lasiodiplodia theobromae]